MSKSSQSRVLSEDVQATESTITGVVDLNSLHFQDLPSLGDLPEPPPPIQGPSQKASNREGDCEESTTDEMQNAWLASLNGRIRYLEARAQAAVKHAEADGTLTDNALRKDMADKTFSFMERWCIFVGLVIFIYIAKHDGDPPKEVILALLGTCTISIIGLVGFVVSGLFKSSKKE
ncbi:hypothetical protein [Dickeya dadantii]|uniref:hypothetical protein n=1 Tax=Dickeya dadantii TaxID=204038 RepID=UPI000A5CDC27|nr:hypothetical protein [Dickeya dadantii]